MECQSRSIPGQAMWCAVWLRDTAEEFVMSEVVLSHVCRMPNRFLVCWWYSPCAPLTSVNAWLAGESADCGPRMVRILVVGP
jgi:hypothetical protein